MKIVIGCDVDPVLPSVLSKPPSEDIWQCLNNIDRLLAASKGVLPPITWLIRSDESIRFSTGDFASGYTARRSLWQALAQQGHELGWHMHVMSFDAKLGCFGFDPEPKWLSAACGALSAYYDVRSTRTGWDYASDVLFRQLDSLGILVDFSALPGNLAWYKIGRETLRVDWSRCPSEPYHPNSHDYQRPGNLKLIEIPITQFSNSFVGMTRRIAMRIRNGCYSVAGLNKKTRTVADWWNAAPISKSPVLACYFHPEDLANCGLERFLRNLALLADLPNAEFVTASTAQRFLADSV